MALAVVLVGTSAQTGTSTDEQTAAGARTPHAVYLIGALVNAAILLAFLPALIPGETPDSAHGGHDGGPTGVGDMAVAIRPT